MTIEDRNSIYHSLVAEAKRIRAALQLDSIEIVTTYMEEDGSTTMLPAGDGNFHARNASMRELLILRDENIREHARKSANEDDE